MRVAKEGKHKNLIWVKFKYISMYKMNCILFVQRGCIAIQRGASEWKVLVRSVGRRSQKRISTWNWVQRGGSDRPALDSLIGKMDVFSAYSLISSPATILKVKLTWKTSCWKRSHVGTLSAAVLFLVRTRARSGMGHIYFRSHQPLTHATLNIVALLIYITFAFNYRRWEDKTLKTVVVRIWSW